MTEIDDLATPTTPLPHSSNEHYSPTGSVRDADRQDEMVDAGWRQVKVEARQSPLRFLEYHAIRIDTGTVREALSGL